MLTPRFKLSQDDVFLHIIIDAVLAKISDAEIHVDDDEFIFYSTPYYLRLHLPGSVIEDGREKCTYNDGKFSVQFPKKTVREHFEGLDMITKLLTPKGNYSAKSPLIEVLHDESSSTNPAEEEIKGESNAEEEFNWYFEQRPPTASDSYPHQYSYGFANKRSGVFKNLADEFSGICDVGNPDEVSPEVRTQERYKLESKQFDPDYYIADFQDDENIIKRLCSYICPWNSEESDGNNEKLSPNFELTEQQRYTLTQLPKKHYLLDDARDVSGVYLSLVDILFAYSYDVRTTEADKTVESAWTVAKLSSTLSCFETFFNLKDVVTACFRRSLSYPLYRNWNLSQTVLSDVVCILQRGQLFILKCLLEIKELMQEYNVHYILNDLYITDYCVWVQTVCRNRLESLATELQGLTIRKEHCDLELQDWENIAIGEMDSSGESLTEQLSKLRVNKDTDSDDSCSESDGETESHSESDGETESHSESDSETESLSESDGETESHSESDGTTVTLRE
ncbi:protein SHQ1 homolog isoform X1 [Argonauta hians]